MGEIADSLINGEFDFITGEYIGEARLAIQERLLMADMNTCHQLKRSLPTRRMSV